MTDFRTPAAPPWWRPDHFVPKRPFLEARAAILAAIRDVFRALDFVEVETPILQVSPGMEPHLRVFSTVLEAVDPRRRREMHLHTSPEFAMKKLLAAGVERPFQIARVFRNGERSATHHPEFSMIEWYRAHEPYTALIYDCRMLLQAAARAAADRSGGDPLLHWQGATADPFAPWQVLTVHQAFADRVGIDLDAAIDDPLDPDVRLLEAQTRTIGIPAHPDDRWDDLFFRVFLDRIEPMLGQDAPTILTDYPVCMAALSRPKPGTPAVAERFELYVGGLELANAFGELTDPVEQRRRFEADMDLRARVYGNRLPIDEDFIAALEHGLPPSAGIALGFDRLVMLATGASRIDQVLWAPVASI